MPWAEVKACGYACGRVLLRAKEQRQRITLIIGIAATLLFVVLRGFNAYGNPPADFAFNAPGPWQPQASLGMTIVAFLDLEKYPASLQFLLMTIGPGLILLSLLDRVSPGSRLEKVLHPLLVFGRVPLFFYVLHIYLIHILAVLMALAFRQP